MEWLVLLQGATALVEQIGKLIVESGGDPPTQEQINSLKAERAALEDEWESLAP